jgi:SWI/SNF-related matrix-associated actin-dependent regulator 1 of chromatin subfamily A
MPGRYYRAQDKIWVVPLHARAYIDRFKDRFNVQQQAQRAENFDVIPELDEMPYEWKEKLLSVIRKPDGKIPFHYQLNGAWRGVHLKKYVNGDAPGLGKTLQSIMTLELLTLMGNQSMPALVICPSSLRLNWQREIQMWTNKKAVILSDRIKHTWKEFIRIGAAQYIICNYESLKKYFVAEIKKPNPDAPLRLNYVHFHDTINLFKAVIIDESHRVKETKTQQTKFVAGLCRGKEYVLALTGTPVVNKPRDLASQLAILEQIKHFGNYKAFLNRYCEGYNGASNLRELNYLINKNCFYRREKKDVLKELPDKMRQIVLCEIATRYEYTQAQNDLENYLKEYKKATDEQIQKSMRGEIMVRIGHLKNISARGKIKDVVESIQEVIDSGEKMVVFVHLKEVAAALKKEFPEAVTILGDDPTHIRQLNVDAFQNQPQCKLIICSIKAGGVGVTLTAASRVAFVELPWHAADCDQCEDRCHRIGQKDSVQCTYFLGKDTIDEEIYKIIDKKRLISKAITGSSENIQEEIIDMMMGSLFNKKNKVDPDAPDFIEPAEAKQVAQAVPTTLFEQEGF